jgi:hypothetical protein
MRTVACPNCGAPQTDAPSDRPFFCTFCGKRVEPDPPPAPPWTQAPAPPMPPPQSPFQPGRLGPTPWLDQPTARNPAARLIPVLVAGIAGLFMVAGAVMFLVFARARPGPPAVSPPSRDTPLAVGSPSTLTGDAGAGATSTALGDVETNPVTLVWHGKVRAATGDRPVAAGAPCTLTQVMVHGSKRNEVSTQLLTFECHGRMLYDSSVQLEGMASESSSFEELPIAGELHAYQYTTKQQDIGTRSGDRNQITLSTRDGFVEAFRDTPPTFHVKATIEELTGVRQGKPLVDDDAPSFPDVVRRVATVTSRSGAVPFATNKCDLAISPAGSGEENCRVLLTCGGKAIFGGGTVGFEKCAMDKGEPVSLVDPYPTPKDHDPELSVDLGAGSATLGDTLPGGAQYTVGFSLK